MRGPRRTPPTVARAVFKEDGPIGWDAKGAKPVVLTECCGLLSRKGSPFSRKAVGFLGTSEEGEDALVHPTERRLRGNVAAASEGLGQGEVGKISLALGRTARAGKNASSSEAYTATGPRKFASSSLLALRGARRLA